MNKEQPEALQLPTMPFAVFDEFGQPCEDRVRDHFAAAFDELRAQIGQGVPDGWLLIATDAYEAGYGKGLNAKQTGRETENPWGDEPGRGAWAIGYELAKERASAPPAPQQKPLTREQRDAAISVANRMLEHGAPMSWEEALIDAVEAAHNIGEKK